MDGSQTWIDVPDGSDFPVHNLPYGVFEARGDLARVGAALGEYVLDLSWLDLPHREDFEHPSLNLFLARGPDHWASVRARLN